MKAQKFLLEIYSEEIPPSAQDFFLMEFRNIAEKTLTRRSLAVSNLECEITSCRIVLLFDIEQGAQEHNTTNLRGPKTTAEQQALVGFMKKHNIKKRSDLTIENEHYVYRINTASEAGLQALLTITIKEICLKASSIWHKRMRWDSSRFEWIRPIKSIVCMLDEKVIPINICCTKPGNTTFQSKRSIVESSESESEKTIIITQSGCYKKLLTQNNIILSKQKRIESIEHQIEELCKTISSKSNKSTKPDNHLKLVEKLAGLSENPKIMLGQTKKLFKELPQQILLQTMIHHQFYIPLYDENKNLDCHFLFLCDTDNKQKNTVTKGNEAVLFARFSDARFFFEKDQKIFQDITAISTNVAKEKLSKISLGDIKLGDMQKKSERIAKIFIKIAETYTKISTKDKEMIYGLMYILKLDLSTSIVQEFPELQGSIGSEYWKRWWSRDFDIENEFLWHQNLKHEIANIIEKQHDINQKSFGFFGRFLIIANSIEHLCSLFLSNKKPTSSQDPFGAKKHVKNILLQSAGTAYTSTPIKVDLSLEGVLPKEIDNAKKETSCFIMNRLFGADKNLICSTWNIEQKDLENTTETKKESNMLIIANKIKIQNEMYKKTQLLKNIELINNRLTNLLQTIKHENEDQSKKENQEEMAITMQTKKLQKINTEAESVINQNLKNENLDFEQFFSIGEKINHTIQEMTLKISTFISGNIISGNRKRIQILSEANIAIQKTKALIEI